MKNLLRWAMLFIATDCCNSITMAMSSSLRRTAAPAMQSGLRYASGSTGTFSAVPQTISIPVRSTSNFEPMPVQKNSYTGMNSSPSMQNNSKQLMQSWQSQRGNDGSSSGSGSSNAFWQASIFATFGTMFAAAKKQAHADKEQEEIVDVSKLLDKKSLDARLYPELAKFLTRYSCSADLEKRAKRVQWTQNYMKNNPSNVYNGLDNERYILEQNPILQKGGYFNNTSPGGKGGFVATSGDSFNDSASEFFVKGSEIDRIINAERMKVVLKENKLHHFAVASECLMHHDNSISVISHKINLGDQDKKVSLQELQETVKIIETTGYADLQFGNNIMRDAHGKLIFVDTEDISYGVNLDQLQEIAKQVGLSKDEMYILVYNKFSKISMLKVAMMIGLLKLDEDAEQWLDEKLKSFGEPPQFDPSIDTQETMMKKMVLVLQEKAKTENIMVIPLSQNPEYDAAIGIDFEKVKREFKLFQEAQIKEID